MKGLTKFDPPLRRLLKKQCSIIKVDPETIDFSENDWYHKHSWTEKQEAQFKKWFIDTLFKNKKLCRDLYRIAAPSKKWLRDAFSYYNLQYGWKYAKTCKC